jgi:glyoxylase-like metal-dependent hydrolase (beta-lactamase superfamily II)
MRRIAAADWYRVRRLDDGVTWIDEPFVKEFYRCNIWHLRGRDRDLLVDSGWGVVSLREHIPLVSERPLVAVASHTHFDHIAGHHEFEERWVHRAEASILARPTRESTLAEPYAMDEAFDVLPPLPLRLDHLLPKSGTRDAGARGRRRGRPRRPGAGGDPHTRPFTRRNRAVRAGHRYPVLGRHRL